MNRDPVLRTSNPFTRRRRTAGMLAGVALLAPSATACGNLMNDEPAITDSPIAPTVTATATITETAPPSRGAGSTATLSQQQPESNGYTMFTEPLVKRGNYFSDYLHNGTGKGDAVGPPTIAMASCVAYDPDYANDKNTHGLWYKIADDQAHAGQYIAASLTFNAAGNRYDPDVPPCNPDVPLPAAHKK